MSAPAKPQRSLIRARVWLIAWCIACTACIALLVAYATLLDAAPRMLTRMPWAGPAVASQAQAQPKHATIQRSAPPTLVALAPAHERAHKQLPHPISADHLRLYREADLLDGAAAALRAHDIEDARALLASHRAEYAPRYSSDNEGLALLADCLQARTVEHVARAQAFYDEHTASMVRRQLRVQCLQAPREPLLAGAGSVR